MAPALEITRILDAAIGREQEAFAFYSRAAERVANPTVRETFTQLAQDELGHKVFLQACLEDPRIADRLPAPADYRVAEATEEQPLSTDMKPAEALALAMKREQGSAEFYRGLAAAATEATLRAMLENLARMELGHKTRLEHMFVDIGYPEAF